MIGLFSAETGSPVQEGNVTLDPALNVSVPETEQESSSSSEAKQVGVPLSPVPDASQRQTWDPDRSQGSRLTPKLNFVFRLSADAKALGTVNIAEGHQQAH